MAFSLIYANSHGHRVQKRSKKDWVTLDWTSNTRADLRRRYHNAYSPHAGVIIGNNVESPRHMQRDRPSLVLPDLQAWSDVTWLEWVQQCQQAGVDPGNLRFVIHEFISNEETIEVIKGILTARGLDPEPDWPGLRVDIDTDDGKALFGTPNGSKFPSFISRVRPQRLTTCRRHRLDAAAASRAHSEADERYRCLDAQRRLRS